MPVTYCPASGCGAAINYVASKPTTCPVCKQPFAAAFASVIEAAVVSTIPSPRVVAKPSVRAEMRRQYVKTARPSYEEAAAAEQPRVGGFMRPIGAADDGFVPPDADIEVPNPDGSNDFVDTDLTLDEIKARAEHIDASAFETGIQINGLEEEEDDRVMSFRSLADQIVVNTQKAAAQPKPRGRRAAPKRTATRKR